MSGPRVHLYHHHHHHHQQWPQPLPVTHALAPPPPPPPPPIPGEIPGHSSIDEVRTIFISGLPGDVKERELLNLLRWLPGFEASQINSKGEQSMGFALFSTPQHAVAAKNALQDMVFDAETKCTINAEMAKKNLFVKRGVGADFRSFDQSKRLRTGGDFAHSCFQSPSPFNPQPVAVWATPGYMAPPAPYDPFGGYPVPQVAIPSLAPVPALSGYATVQNAKDNPPCNTLFVGNLGENVVEEELKGLFSIQPGYKQMKILRQERNTVCFIEFDANQIQNQKDHLIAWIRIYILLTGGKC
ncbi:hypothetical protein M5K25_024899 [Dendrobium thyrsiflorum]|uniref:RRM domain-containing protein n=1 Tax=Dendrobium thyrsiflorum TaxID=117978 RepID=A0ABD0U399_DENTH